MRARHALLGLLVALAGPAALSAPPRDAADAARALDDPRWEERRRAEDDLREMGAEALAAPTEEGAVLLAAWDAALSTAEREGGPGAVEAVARVLARLEPGLDNEAVRRVPRLLRARLERFVPDLVVPMPTAGDYDLEGFDEDAWRVASISVRSLMPQARAALVDVVRTSPDARRVAGAMVPLSEAREADDASLLDAIGEAWDADPDRIAAATRFATFGARPPVVTVAMALAVTGRAAQLPRLRARLASDVLGAFGSELRQRLPARGEGDLGLGEFLGRLEEGTAVAADEAEAARRALDGGVPWLARLLARRALFLDRGHEAARATLVAADERIGLAATARRDAGEPPPADLRDDPESRAIDAALRAGRLSQRILHRIEAGSDAATGLAPVAIGNGFLVVGTTRGRVVLLDADTGRERSMESTSVARVPRGLAVGDGVVAAVTGRGGVFFWGVTPRGLRRLAIAAGPFLAVAAAPDGTFWFLAANRALWRAKGPVTPQPVAGLEAVRGWTPTSFGVLEDGAVLLAGAGKVVRFDPATGTSTPLAEGPPATLRAAPYGRGAVVARGDAFDVVSETGERTGGGRFEEGTGITGVAGDPSTGTVYVATAQALLACAATDGTVRWREQVEGSGNPALGRGLVAVSAGLGTDEGGDNRTDRTISVLRAATGGRDPFEPDARVKAVEAAVTAARDGKPAVARALLDPILAWLTPSERWAAEQALREIEAPREPGAEGK